MPTILSYVGPGLGLGTLAIIGVVLLIVLASILLIIWIPLKNAFKKVIKFFTR